MANIPYAELKKGTFLIASPNIEEGIFYRSVVLLCDHSPVGSFGLIVNKPLDVQLEEDFFGLAGSDTQIDMRAGGPNQPNQVMLIQDQRRDEETSLQICEGVYLNGDVESIQEKERIPQTLLCFGYGGWASGALEREFLSGAWFLFPATKEHIFNSPAAKLWQTLLREMGGKYKTLSLLPEDLELN
ncbi:MAG: YqgE/AlgH family protein [Simkaniaceae bacterium]|nr:YqgE/AlgH family protein [Simkaniaceae bacterium]